MVTRTNIYGDRKVKFVVLTINGYTCKYGFKTPVDDSVGTVLGHTEMPTDTPQEFIFGANSPKPARASKDGVSSWIATDKIPEARQAGWKVVKRPRFRGTRVYANRPSGNSVRNRGSVGVYVETRGIFYAWRMPNYQYSRLVDADFTELDIKVPNSEADMKKMVYGASFPRPGRAQKTIAATAGSGTSASSSALTMTTFCSDSATLGTDWITAGEPTSVFAG